MVLSPISTQDFVTFLHFLSPYPWHGQFDSTPSGERHAVRDIAEARASLGPEPLLTLTCINMVVVFLTYLSLGVTILQRYKPYLPPRVAVRSRDQLGEAHATAHSMWSIKSGWVFFFFHTSTLFPSSVSLSPTKTTTSFLGHSKEQAWFKANLSLSEAKTKQNKNKTGQQKQDQELTVA